MLAVLAHHLRAALVPLDVDFAFWTPLDRRVVFLVLVKRAGKGKGGREGDVRTVGYSIPANGGLLIPSPR